jgi:8-oxo-dGTP pyrophosphatase MutT (NUDIX family)
MEKREVVCIAIVNEQHELLIQKRDHLSSKWGEEWSFFGGGIEE